MTMSSHLGLTSALLGALLLFAPTPSHAESASREDEPDHWYGWQTLIADGGSLAVGVVGGIMDLNEQKTASSVLLYTGAVGYVAGAPVVHWATGHFSAGFWSLGLRAGLPTVLGFLGYSLRPCSSTPPDGEPHSDDVACFPYVLGGVVLGVLSAVTIDNAVVAREPIARPAEAASRRISIAPVVYRGGGGVVVRGTL